MRCPYCEKEVKTERGMAKHLSGGSAYGGHELPIGKAQRIAKRVQKSPYIISKKVPMNTSLNTPQTNIHFNPVPEFSPTGEFLVDLFNSLAHNKALPKYQFERRIDAIIGLFLPEIFSAIFGWNTTVVAPEFPIKRPGNNQTTNADYALFRHGTPSEGVTPAWILFELKTDSLSIREAQSSTYRYAQKRGMKVLRCELDEVFRATQHKKKYANLLGRIDKYPIDCPIEIVYLLPKSSGLSNREGIHILTFQDLEQLTLPLYSEAWTLFQKQILPILH